MVTDISPEIKEKLDTVGVIKTGDIGGQPKRTYWTPDGRELKIAPSWHEFAQRDAAGNVIASGIRDANLDKGYLLQKPVTLKPYCSGCDLWHDTEQEVAACQEKQMRLLGIGQGKAKKELTDVATGLNSRFDRLEALEREMGEMKALLMQLVKGK